MKTIKTKDFSKYSLELIFNEADKHFTDVLTSVSKTSERSFYAFGLYLSLFAYSFSKLLLEEYVYLILILGAVLSSFILSKNLFPTTREVKGSSPSDMINDYFLGFKNEELDKEYLATQIESYEKSIRLNKALVGEMVKRYLCSFKILTLFVIAFFIVFFLFSVKG